jgi:hypothetical protein
VQEGEGVTENGEYSSVSAQRLRLPGQFGAFGAILVRSCGEMIDHALTIRPRRECGRQRIVGIELHRAFKQVQRMGVALGIERKHAGHRPQRYVVRAQIGFRLAAGAIDFREAQAWLHRRDDFGGQMLVDNSLVIERAIGTVRR